MIHGLRLDVLTFRLAGVNIIVVMGRNDNSNILPTLNYYF